ncbi:MAG TPA: hypothetical protein VI306_16680 [Pyrinomonadaceae bacterium]
MKFVKKFVLPVLFVSVLAVNTYAGEIQTPGITAPPPPQHSVSETPITDGPTPNVPTDATNELSDQLFYKAITAVLSMF